MQAEKTVVIVGAGPAGLMAAEVAREAGHRVIVYDAKPSACRKFLLAGVGGMNITHAEPYSDFIQRYYDKSLWLDKAIRQFNADHLRQWIHELGIETFVGSSNRVFPLSMKAAPLLRNWLRRLRESGVIFKMKHRLVAIRELSLTFEYENTARQVTADAVVLALGGGSWPKLGSDGAWQKFLANPNITIKPLQSANCGFNCQWSDHLIKHFAGSPLKRIQFSFTTSNGELIRRKGECILSDYGMEGSLIYAYSKYLRDAINQTGQAVLFIDVLPDLTSEQVMHKLQTKTKKESLSKCLKRLFNLSPCKIALLHETVEKHELHSLQTLAASLKALPVCFTQTAPIEQAISSAGGVCETSLDDRLMVKKMPGLFCAGEMLDWEAPTGGYLLTACFATGRLAGQGVCEFITAVK